MEKKGLFERYTSLWSVFDNWNSNKSILGKLYLFKRTKFLRIVGKNNNFVAGFTLVELLVVIAMIGIMSSLFIVFFNPFKQIEKARDSQRLQSLKQINGALDAYYNDKNCYPDPSLLVFDREWKDAASGSIYMKRVPQDPDCADGGSCFTYITDSTSSCPAWNVLFTKIHESSVQIPTCNLTQLPNCLPSNYVDSGYNYCVLSGQVDCAYISSLTLPTNAGAGTGVTPTSAPTSIPTPIPTSTPTPTPTSVPGVICSNYYAFTGSGPSGPLCNNLGNDPLSQCTVHGGTYICYSMSNCTQPLCQ